MKLVTASEMRELDRRAIQDLGIPSLVLMENAGRTTYQILRREFPAPQGEVAVVAGRGNNGGDGFVVARYLANAGIPVVVFLLGQRDQVSGDARVNLDILAHLGVDGGRGPHRRRLKPRHPSPGQSRPHRGCPVWAPASTPRSRASWPP